ncbi:MAG: hypothetical protein NVS2B8_14670 [Vulcanimicrobiaceae bacterium]
MRDRERTVFEADARQHVGDTAAARRAQAERLDARDGRGDVDLRDVVQFRILLGGQVDVRVSEALGGIRKRTR